MFFHNLSSFSSVINYFDGGDFQFCLKLISWYLRVSRGAGTRRPAFIGAENQV